MATEAYQRNIDDLEVYLGEKIEAAIENNPELQNISRIPLVGKAVTNNLGKTVTEMVNHVVDESLQDLASPQNSEVIDDITHLVLDTFLSEEETDIKLDGLVRDIVIQSLELVKDQVRVQQWKVQEQQDKEEKARNKLEKAVAG